MPEFPGFLYYNGFGSVELLSEASIEWCKDLAEFMDCGNCGRRDACSGICEKAAPTEVEEASAL